MVFIFFRLLRWCGNIKEIPDGYKATAPFMPVLIASAKERPGKVDMQTENYATVRYVLYFPVSYAKAVTKHWKSTVPCWSVSEDPREAGRCFALLPPGDARQ